MVQPHGYVISPTWAGVGFAASTPTGGVNFRVDPDNAEQFIKDMDEVLKRLDEIDRIARDLDVKAPGNESFSEAAAAAFNNVNTDGARGHMVANQKATAAVAGMIRNLKQNLQEYRGTDSDNAKLL